MGFFEIVGERLEHMSSVEQNYREISTFVKSTEHSVNNTRTMISQKKTASSYAIPSDMKKQCKIIQGKYEIIADSTIEEIRKNRNEITESCRRVKSDCQSIEHEVKRMEELFGEAGGKRL